MSSTNSVDRRYPVASVDEIPPGSRKIVDIEGRSVGIFNVNGEFFALRNRCPHEGGPLCLGDTTGFVTAEVPGEYQWDRAGEILRCPWHGWEFELRTGEAWFDPEGVRVKRYDVLIENANGEITIPGPAETYEVSIEGAQVVVDMATRRKRVADAR